MTNRVPVYIIVIPFIWHLTDVSVAIKLGIIEDYGLVAAGMVGSILISAEDVRKRTSRNRRLHESKDFFLKSIVEKKY